MTWYDDIADGYDELRGDEQREKFSVFKPYIDKNMRVLDVGFGTGLSDDYFDAEIIGLEPSQGMLDKHSGDAKTYNYPATAIPDIFEPDSFDAVLCVSTAHHFDDVSARMDSITTITKENGLVLVSVFEESFDELDLALSQYEKVQRCHVHRDIVAVYRLH